MPESHQVIFYVNFIRLIFNILKEIKKRIFKFGGFICKGNVRARLNKKQTGKIEKTCH